MIDTVRYGVCVCLYIYINIYISISTLPSHIYSTILSSAKVTCNTYKNKKLLTIPLKLVPSLVKLPLPYFPPSTGRRGAPPHTQSSHSIFWRRAGRLLCTALSLLSFMAKCFGVKVAGVFYDFSIESSCDVFMHICSYLNVLILRFLS